MDANQDLSTKLGIPNGNLGDFWTSGLAEVFVNGFDTPMIGINGCLPWRRAVTNFDFATNWTKTKGTHLIKWGFDFRRERRDLLESLAKVLMVQEVIDGKDLHDYVEGRKPIPTQEEAEAARDRSPTEQISGPEIIGSPSDFTVD